VPFLFTLEGFKILIYISLVFYAHCNLQTVLWIPIVMDLDKTFKKSFELGSDCQKVSDIAF
jgi:hypothetical protein